MANHKESWSLVVLNHDTGSKHINDFFKKVWLDGIISLELELDHVEYKNKVLEEMEIAVNQIKHYEKDLQKEKILTIYGSGSYHHYTYGLCYTIARRKSKNYLYAHLDNHTDTVKYPNGKLGCGAFVEDIVDAPEAKDIIMIGPKNGVNYKNRTCVDQLTLTSEDAKTYLKQALANKKEKDVYASFDLDILSITEISAFYNQGELKLEHLLDIVHVLKEEKNVISADICGYSATYTILNHSPTGLLAYATIAAKMTGKDTKEPENLHKYFKKRITKTESLEDTYKIKEEFKKVTEQLRI